MNGSARSEQGGDTLSVCVYQDERSGVDHRTVHSGFQQAMFKNSFSSAYPAECQPANASTRLIGIWRSFYDIVRV
jgi:hypothetical protein